MGLVSSHVAMWFCGYLCSVNRMVTKGLLTRLGCDVTAVGSGRECLAAIAGPGHGFKVSGTTVLDNKIMREGDGGEGGV